MLIDGILMSNFVFLNNSHGRTSSIYMVVVILGFHCITCHFTNCRLHILTDSVDGIELLMAFYSLAHTKMCHFAALTGRSGSLRQPEFVWLVLSVESDSHREQ